MSSVRESAGILPSACDEIATTLEMEYCMRTQMSSAAVLIGPTLVVIIFCDILLFILRILLRAQGVAVPFILLLPFLVILAVLGLLLWRILSRTRTGAHVIAFILTRTPFFGAILLNKMRIRFARTLAALWNAGVSPMACVLSAARASGNPLTIYRARFEVPRLGEGASLADVLIPLRILHLLEYPDDPYRGTQRRLA